MCAPLKGGACSDALNGPVCSDALNADAIDADGFDAPPSSDTLGACCDALDAPPCDALDAPPSSDTLTPAWNEWKES